MAIPTLNKIIIFLIALIVILIIVIFVTSYGKIILKKTFRYKEIEVLEYSCSQQRNNIQLNLNLIYTKGIVKVFPYLVTNEKLLLLSKKPYTLTDHETIMSLTYKLEKKSMPITILLFSTKGKKCIDINSNQRVSYVVNTCSKYLIHTIRLTCE